MTTRFFGDINTMPSPANIICQTCGSNKIVRVSGKVSDMCNFICPNHGIDVEGWLPDAISENSDYIDITYCSDCGQLQGNWPKELPEED